MGKLKMYRIIGKEFDCVYISYPTNISIDKAKRLTEERTKKEIDRLEFVKKI